MLHFLKFLSSIALVFSLIRCQASIEEKVQKHLQDGNPEKALILCLKNPDHSEALQKLCGRSLTETDKEIDSILFQSQKTPLSRVLVQPKKYLDLTIVLQLSPELHAKYFAIWESTATDE